MSCERAVSGGTVARIALLALVLTAGCSSLKPEGASCEVGGDCLAGLQCVIDPPVQSLCGIQTTGFWSQDCVRVCRARCDLPDAGFADAGHDCTETTQCNVGRYISWTGENYDDVRTDDVAVCFPR
jgi:hypothetical protein